MIAVQIVETPMNSMSFIAAGSDQTDRRVDQNSIKASSEIRSRRQARPTGARSTSGTRWQRRVTSTDPLHATARGAPRRCAPTIRRAGIDLGQVSPYLVCAIVKAEDRGFFRHSGFEWGQLRKALWRRVTGGSAIGRSAVTPHLAR